MHAGHVRAVKEGVGEVTLLGTIAEVAPDVFTAAVETQRRNDLELAEAARQILRLVDR